MANQRKKIVMLPLDERPCNYLFPKKLTEGNPEYELALPPADILGRKKTPADRAAADAFLREHLDADIAVISLDMLLYGGLLPGRLHRYSEAELSARLETLGRMKKRNPKLKIYAFHLIMRCPQYSSSDEEPDYYGDCGREIFLLGEYLHKQRLGLLGGGEYAELERCRAATEYCIDDYLTRRKVNAAMNRRAVDLAGEVLDYLIIPQDDSAVYGFAAEDQLRVKNYVRARRKQLSVAIYPGADEVGLTLLARAVAEDKGVSPRVSVFYSAVGAPFAIPKYEDRMLGESVKSQIAAAGCTPSDGEADLTLAVNAPSGNMLEADRQSSAGREYAIERNLAQFAERVAALVRQGKQVGVADVAFANGGDLELAEMLDSSGTAMRLAGYAGWNTSGNSLGTVLAAMTFGYFFGGTPAHARFLALRYYEDVAFCSCARKAVTQTLADMGLHSRDLKERGGAVAERVREAAEKALGSVMPSVGSKYRIAACRMPWNRMFEADLSVDER